MTLIDELKAKVDAAQQNLRSAQNELSVAIIDTAKYKIGDVMVSERGKKVKINHIGSFYGEVCYSGYAYKKDGTVGERQVTLYSFDKWTKVEE